MMAAKSLLTAATAAALLSAAQSTHAFQIFFGEDLNNTPSSPLASTPNASGAEADFLGNLSGAGTEDFEGFTPGTSAPLNLTFPGVGTATLSGGNGTISSIPPGFTNGVGRYATSGSNFFEVEAGGSGNFAIDIENEIAAFGFFGVDIGDFGGQLVLELSNGDTQSLTVPNTQGSGGSTDGSVIFFGVIAETLAEQFTRVEFLTTTGTGDFFAFDDFTLGSIAQVVDPDPIPAPASLGLMLLGLAALHRRRR